MGGCGCFGGSKDAKVQPTPILPHGGKVETAPEMVNSMSEKPAALSVKVEGEQGGAHDLSQPTPLVTATPSGVQITAATPAVNQSKPKKGSVLEEDGLNEEAELLITALLLEAEGHKDQALNHKPSNRPGATPLTPQPSAMDLRQNQSRKDTNMAMDSLGLEGFGVEGLSEAEIGAEHGAGGLRAEGLSHEGSYDDADGLRGRGSRDSGSRGQNPGAQALEDSGLEFEGGADGPGHQSVDSFVMRVEGYEAEARGLGISVSPTSDRIGLGDGRAEESKIDSLDDLSPFRSQESINLSEFEFSSAAGPGPAAVDGEDVGALPSLPESVSPGVPGPHSPGSKGSKASSPRTKGSRASPTPTKTERVESGASIGVFSRVESDRTNPHIRAESQISRAMSGATQASMISQDANPNADIRSKIISGAAAGAERPVTPFDETLWTLLSFDELLQRQFEVEHMIRWELKEQPDVDNTKIAVENLLRNVHRMKMIARERGIANEGLVFQELLAMGSAQREDESIVTGLVDLSDVDKGELDHLITQVEVLRGIIRLKIQDASDLRTASKTLKEAHSFFNSLASHAQTKGVSSFEMLEQLRKF